METLKQRLLKLIKNYKSGTYNEFAQSIGVDKNTISYWMSRGGSPSENNLKTICEVHNVTEKWLLYGDDDDDISEKCKELKEEINFLKKQLQEKSDYIELLKLKLKEK